MTQFEQWNGFEGRLWKEEINVRDFIQKNYKPYEGDESFLAGPTEATDKLWGILQESAEGGARKGRRSGYGYPHRFRYHFPWPWLHQRRLIRIWSRSLVCRPTSR